MIRRLPACLAVVAMLFSLASCGLVESRGRPSDGPLTVRAGSGGFAFAEPKHQGPWTGTFGSFRLCNKAAGAESRLIKVIPDVSLKPTRIETWTRSVGRGEKHDNFASALGSPPAWNEAYADPPHGGTWRRGVSGLEIHQSCATAKGDDDYTELVFVLTSDVGGAEVQSARVVYTADGRRYSTNLRWEMILCGDSPTVHEHCKGNDGA